MLEQTLPARENKVAMRTTETIWRCLIRTAPGCILIALITYVCYRLRLNLTITGFGYLIVVVLQSLFGSFASSATVSVLAVLCLDFFFTPPLFSFEVTNPLDVLALISFLITGLVITRLNTKARAEAAISNHQRQQVGRLYELAQGLLASDPEKSLSVESIGLFQRILGLRAVCLFDGMKAEIHQAGDSSSDLAEETRSAYLSGQDYENNCCGILVRCLHVGGKTMGAVGFKGLREPELMAGPLSALAAAMLERTYTFGRASYAAAATQAELFRGAILDALAHEFKTPLATIIAAAGGLREIGGLRPEQMELTDSVEAEAARLSSLTSRLLRTALLDRVEVRPEMELTDLSGLVAELAEQYSRQWTDRKVSISKEAANICVMADAELLQLALRQLLDNACKYSVPGSAVTVSIDSQKEWVAVRTLNSGSFIHPNERSRIFERFYRGADTRLRAPGSGLGLYVARKIVHAHGGSLELDAGMTPDSTAFHLALPLAATKA